VLLTLVIVYLLITIAIGLVAAKRVKNSADFAIAGRHLPLYMIVTTTFATWFGSETVLGIPAKFIEGGLGNVVEDPFGAGFCLILVGLFFAGKLYRMTLLTISDYYRERYGRVVEVVCSLIIMLSYLGWVSAQVTALGLVFNLLSGGAISIPIGMTIGVVSILAYTLFGGMWSVAVTDFIQMIILVVGLTLIAVFAGNMAGGADKVIELASSRELFRFLPEPSFHDIAFFIAAAITMMFGSIPQQDVFQRVMSANNIHAANHGAPRLAASSTSCLPLCRCFWWPARSSSCRPKRQSCSRTIRKRYCPRWCWKKCLLSCRCSFLAHCCRRSSPQRRPRCWPPV